MLSEELTSDDKDKRDEVVLNDSLSFKTIYDRKYAAPLLCGAVIF